MSAALALTTREVLETEVSGVRALWAPGDGMVFARLQFRVGQADERLANRGVTHLVEHLAFERLGQPTYSFNGSVSMETTAFDVAGTQEEVVDFLRVITSGLHDPPAERLTAERHLLKVESQRRGGVFDELASVRHGARGQGLSAYLELGLEHLDADDLRTWSQTWFTADNAVLWLWGGDPSALDLTLPRGQWFPLPAVESRPLPPRSWIPWGDSGAALTFHTATDRGTANAVAWWLQRHLSKALRHYAGLAYAVHVQQRQVGDDRLFAVGVDGAPDRAGELRDALLAALESLSTVQVPDEEIVAWKREMKEALLSAERGAELGRLDLAATGILLSGEVIRPEEVVEQFAAVTPEGVASVVRGWHQTCVLAVPQNTEMPEAWKAVRRDSDSSVSGGEVFVPAARALQGHRLIVAPEGITARASAGLRWTVRWDDCAAVLRHADGSLTPIGSDGVTVQLLATDWVGGQQLVTDLSRRLAPSLMVPVDTRPTDQIVTGLRGLATVSTGALSLIVAVFWLSTLALLSSAPGEENPASLVWTGLGAGILAGYLTWALVIRLRAPKERRALPKEPSRMTMQARRWLAAQTPERLRTLEIAAWAVTALLVVLLVLEVFPGLLPSIFTALLARRFRRERREAEAPAAG